ncbi:MAG TPA: L-lactate permease, partial [Gemmataceae bacterium]|nr:L-lactate permease [Gemmataceae bacterium]
MLVAAVYVQNLDPLGHPLLSTLLAAVPVVVLFWVLVPLHRPAPLAAFLGALAAILVASLVFKMA